MTKNIITVQEITLVAYDMGIYNILQDVFGWGRDEVFLHFQDWADEFEKAHENYDWDGDFYDEIDIFLEKKKAFLLEEAER